MTDEQLLADLKTAFEYAHRHDEWVAPLDEELADISAEEAARRPGAGAKSIWEIVLHTAVWNENILERINSGEKTRPEEGAWPSMPEIRDEAAWNAAQQRLFDSLRAIEDFLAETTLDKIEQSPYGLPDLLVRYIHVGYHLGQITKIREEFRRTS